MASNGIRDRVAIVGMGCTTFGERWDKSVSDLLVESSQDALKSANVPIDAVDAFWLGTLFSGQSGLTLSRPLKLDYKPVSRLENYCATGSEAFRNACYAVACGAYDLAMAIGVEKLKDSGISGLPSIEALRKMPWPNPADPAHYRGLRAKVEQIRARTDRGRAPLYGDEPVGTRYFGRSCDCAQVA